MQEPGGGDVVVGPTACALRRRLLRAAHRPGVLRQPRLARHFPQEFGQLGQAQPAQRRPLRWRQRDHHPFVRRSHLVGQVVVRHLRLDGLAAVLRPQRRPDRRQHVVRHQRHREPEQSRFRIGQRVDLADQGFGQCLEHVLEPPALPVSLGQRPGVGPLPRHVRQQEQFLLLVPGRLVQVQPDAAEGHCPAAVRLGDRDRLLGHRPGGDPAHLGPRRALLPVERRLVLTHQEAAAAGAGAEDQPRRAEVAVGDPEVAGLDPRQHLIDQGPLLGVGVLARDNIDDQHGGRVEDHQRLPRQGRGAGRAGRRDAMLGAGEVVAVEDLGAVARDRLGQGGVELTDQRRESPGVVQDEGTADAGLQPLQLLVERRERSGDLAQRSQVGGTDGGLGPADDGAHQLDHRGEEHLPGVLTGRVFLEKAIDLGGIEGVLQQRAKHHRDRGLLDEPLEDLAESHGCRPWMCELSSETAVGYQCRRIS